MVFSPAHPLVGIGGALAIVDSLCLVPFLFFFCFWCFGCVGGVCRVEWHVFCLMLGSTKDEVNVRSGMGSETTCEGEAHEEQRRGAEVIVGCLGLL